ncbi:GNAT family N-acetyltransferase [Staphylococcus epidermidis]|nr:GNAT family N-acetyltransferase [Staphylococcus epidermidis]MCG1157031.1 GNAT family N-acetyltransferase [Staphylococcus epidermidis]
MNIRILTEKDVNEFKQLRLKGLKVEPNAFGSTYENESDFNLEIFKSRLKPSDFRFIVGGFCEGKLVCIASFTRESGQKTKHKSVLSGVYCEKEYRGTGIAKDVVGFILQKARNLEGLEIINLKVVSENLRAKNFYKAYGFKKYGTELKSLFDGTKYYNQDLMYLELN